MKPGSKNNHIDLVGMALVIIDVLMWLRITNPKSISTKPRIERE
jgi:hypothetical protein